MGIPLKAYWQLLSQYLRPHWKRASLLGLLVFAGLGLQLVAPLVIRYFIDGALSGRELTLLVPAAILFVVVSLISQALNAYSLYVGEDIAWTATNSLRADLAAHCLGLDMGFHKAHTPGEMIERIDGDVNALSNFFSQISVRLVGNFGLIAGILILLFLEDWRVGLALSFFAVLTVLVLNQIRAWAVPYHARERQTSAELYGFLGEQLSGTEDIRSSGAAGHVMRLFDAMLRRRFKANWADNMAGYSVWMSMVLLFAFGDAAGLGVGVWLWQRGAVTLGTVYLIFHYTQMLTEPLEAIRNQIQGLQRAGGSIGRIQTLFETQSRIGAGNGASLPTGPLSIAFQDVSFAYEPGDPVLRDLSFALEPGQVLGLLGRTGSGKTTVSRLLLRLYDPESGEIRLGDVPLRQVGEQGMRRRIGMVTQEVQLFHASVRNNLTFFDRTIPDDAILRVLNELGLQDWLDRMPQGLDTQLDPGGLSAGEAQLLTFARIFLFDPGLVILDEATSRLDPTTEGLLERAVDRLLQGRTGVIIAHRLSTVQRADHVLILENGRVLEYGNRAQLAVDSSSHFHHLLAQGLEEVLV